MLIKFLRSIADRTPTFVMKFFFNIYPPYFGAGVQVEKKSDDHKYMRVKLKLRFYNRNYVGTQFGGSIYSMTDPHFMFLLIKNLGPDYIVWDKAAKIDFLKPGKTDLIAEFQLTNEIIQTVKEKTAGGEKYIFDLPVSVIDRHGEKIASIEKTLYVRKKRST